MNAKEFLKHKGIFDTQYIVDCDGESIELEKLLIEYQALQLQQTGVNGSFCSNCRWLNSCAIRIDYNVDTCEEHEF